MGGKSPREFPPPPLRSSVPPPRRTCPLQQGGRKRVSEGPARGCEPVNQPTSLQRRARRCRLRSSSSISARKPNQAPQRRGGGLEKEESLGGDGWSGAAADPSEEPHRRFQ